MRLRELLLFLERICGKKSKRCSFYCVALGDGLFGARTFRTVCHSDRTFVDVVGAGRIRWVTRGQRLGT